MEVAIAPQLGFTYSSSSQKDIELDNTPFVTDSETMYYLEQLLDPEGKPLENATNALPEVLHKFLRVIGKNTRALLRQHVGESDLTRNPEKYEIYKQEYRDSREYARLDVNKVLFLIHEEFLIRNPLPLGPVADPHSTEERIRMIMSSVIWMEEIFPASDSEAWKLRFVELSTGTTKDDLYWLCLVRQKGFLVGCSLPGEDENILDRLWFWFRANTHREVQLAFSMARRGMLRDVLAEAGRLIRIIEDLRDRIGLPPDLGPTRYI
ncbi:RelA/SpoT [Penicillium angulare]|uniref:RelA/SpoT n=1 Tax=Penicillium angulare TaxID=116970 RepID=A0A9W9K984_9EURO|nr:RelA/SpoT [Penicillium angulare]